MRTGAWTLGVRVEDPKAVAETLGKSFPIACSRGSPSMTPAPRRKVRRGICQYFIQSDLFWVKTVAERIAGRNLFDQHHRPVLIVAERFHRAIHGTVVEPVQFPAKGK